MDKKLLEAIVEMAKAAGADVKVVGINRDENKGVKEGILGNIPLLKFEVGIKKDGDELKAIPTYDWNILGSIFLETAPIGVDIDKVKEMFTPARNAFNHCCNELDKYIKEQFKGALEDEEERIRRESC